MKKYIKILVLALICVIAMTSLVGCDELDQMRDSQAKLVSETVISYGGYEYILLPECKYIWQDSGDTVFITDSDVPVLLSALLGRYANLSSTDYMITTLDNENYCRSDKYDQVLSAINSGVEMNGYFYTYLSFDAELYAFKNEKYMLGADEISAVNRAVSDGAVDADDVNASYVVDLYACSQDMIFADYFCGILASHDGYYLSVYDQISFEYIYYAVRAEDASLFENMLSDFMSIYQ